MHYILMHYFIPPFFSTIYSRNFIKIHVESFVQHPAKYGLCELLSLIKNVNKMAEP